MHKLMLTIHKEDAVLSQEEPRDAAISFDTTASCGFTDTPRVSCIGLHQRPFKCWNFTLYL